MLKTIIKSIIAIVIVGIIIISSVWGNRMKFEILKENGLISESMEYSEYILIKDHLRIGYGGR